MTETQTEIESKGMAKAKPLVSRIGKHPVGIPSGVDVIINAQDVRVKGKHGELAMRVVDEIGIEIKDEQVVVFPVNRSRRAKEMWATTRTLISNLVVGVSEGFQKKLEITGVGYRAQVQGTDLVLNLGHSHEVRYPMPEMIKIECPTQTEVLISGPDKQKVGQVAAEIRSWRPPEPYKGKGVRYAGEFILRKEGKKK